MTHNNNDFVYQSELQQSTVKVLIYKMESGIGDKNKHEYESKNENDKMLQKTQERLDQTSRCKRNLKNSVVTKNSEESNSIHEFRLSFLKQCEYPSVSLQILITRLACPV